MQSPSKDLEKRYTKWLMAYRATQGLLIAHMGLFFFNFFTEWKSAYQFVYGETIWPAIGIAQALALFLSKTFGTTNVYYSLLTENDGRP